MSYLCKYDTQVKTYKSVEPQAVYDRMGMYKYGCEQDCIRRLLRHGLDTNFSIETRVTEVRAYGLATSVGYQRFYLSKNVNPECHTFSDIKKRYLFHHAIRGFPNDYCIAIKQLNEPAAILGFAIDERQNNWNRLFNIGRFHTEIIEISSGEIYGEFSYYYYRGGWVNYLASSLGASSYLNFWAAQCGIGNQIYNKFEEVFDRVFLK